ncbi:class I SAM-dependent methyltransferase [Halomonas elongata]|uniref:Class I SAM-dependent methyltransferase n=1 Tax=Halomonas elongata (strain ATCC 33173 / DSM 2581 / NBRC 15536 / NCIMB 2198 / 1H9) TaxID=768066 RepID=E1V406_HALED|nr:class I SAM-dependent methyltransferase [Halomonas elongata]WBF16578.1 methyltransferase domain-containing protein [Halomonas elongata]WPU49019.1 class I SAM-dependent methyltransferase [Halomonas elongata DSM 2581]CBV42835.1 probable S-adenosylmethionine-dependent methyltransferase [Halomonas elongata DSM 2581]
MCDTTLAIQPTTDDFEARLVQALNHGGLLLLTSLGYRTGLLEAMAGQPPITSQALAERTGLQERYVREWLGGMVAAEVVETDSATASYWLPDERAALLTDRGEANLAVYAQFMPLLGSVEDDVLRCFREGGGVPYSRYPRFQEVMASDSGQTVLPALFDGILPLAPGLIERLESGIRVLDCACGRGRALLAMAERFPASRFTGYDLSEEAIGWARAQAERAGLTNLNFEVRDLSDFDTTATPGAFELVTTFDGIHDQGQPRRLLKGIHRSLTSDGIYLVQDIHASSHHHLDREHPLGAMLYAVSISHCMTVSLAQGGEGLGTMWGRERALAYLEEAGFRDIQVHQLEHDIQNDYFVCRP